MKKLILFSLLLFAACKAEKPFNYSAENAPKYPTGLEKWRDYTKEAGYDLTISPKRYTENGVTDTLGYILAFQKEDTLGFNFQYTTDGWGNYHEMIYTTDSLRNTQQGTGYVLYKRVDSTGVYFRITHNMVFEVPREEIEE